MEKTKVGDELLKRYIDVKERERDIPNAIW